MFSVLGPLARTVEDAAALLDAMAVPCPAEPVIAPPLPPGQSFLQLSRVEPGRLRIGRYADSPIAGVELAPECRRAWEDTAMLLADLGHEVVEKGMGIDYRALFAARGPNTPTDVTNNWCRPEREGPFMQDQWQAGERRERKPKAWAQTTSAKKRKSGSSPLRRAGRRRALRPRRPLSICGRMRLSCSSVTYFP